MIVLRLDPSHSTQPPDSLGSWPCHWSVVSTLSTYSCIYLTNTVYVPSLCQALTKSLEKPDKLKLKCQIWGTFHLPRIHKQAWEQCRLPVQTVVLACGTLGKLSKPPQPRVDFKQHLGEEEGEPVLVSRPGCGHLKHARRPYILTAFAENICLQKQPGISLAKDD